MDEEVALSRAKISRRRALGLGGSIGIGALLAACAAEPATTGGAASSAGATPTPTASDDGAIQASTASTAELVARLDAIGVCGTETEEVTQGPYYFDVDSIRSDLREDRPGTTLRAVFRVRDVACAPLPNSVVEIWHCDAGGVYSGFESASTGGGVAGGGPGGGTGGASSSGETSDGAYSSGVSEAGPTDDGTYLRGAQVADAKGIVQFTTVWPGWYSGRTVHIHLKVHVDKVNVLTAQVGFDDALNDAIFATSPYSAHVGRDTYNGGSAGSGTDGIVTSVDQLMTVEQTSDGYLAYINLEVDV